MRKTILGRVMSGFVVVLLALDVSARPDASTGMPKRGNARFYEAHASHLRRAEQGPVNLVFIGDSITERWNEVPDIWNEFFGIYNPANFGIGGDQTRHVIWRIEDGILDKVRPTVVVILIGTNNTGRDSPEEIAAANRKVIGLVRGKVPGVKILLMGIFPRGPRTDAEGKQIDDGVTRMKVIRAVNPLLARLADGELVRFVDIGDRFIDSEGRISPTLMPDQVHLSAEGYRLWALSLKPLLAEWIR